MSIPTVLASAMELTADERAQLARWLDLCVRAGIELDPDSVRAASEAELRQLLSGVRA